MQTAPIVVFAYRRPKHLQRLFESLRANPEAPSAQIHVYSDGPRDRAEEKSVGEVRDVIRDAGEYLRVRPVFRERNLGLSANVISGVTEVLSSNPGAIVLEDDLELSPFFLNYMHTALDRFRDEPRVASVHGYVYPVKADLPESFFLRGADCWGWATWQDRWAWFNPDGKQLRSKLRELKLSRSINMDGAYDYMKMLDEQIAGRVDSWAIRWHASCFIRGALTLWPGRSLVGNTGLDGDRGTHCTRTDAFDSVLAAAPITKFPDRIEEDPGARDAIRRFLGAL